jgi:peptidyl-prolyl cis-trans isomerase SurA
VVYTPNEHMPEQQSVRIVYLKSRSKPHRESLSEDYSRIQAQALQQKQSKELNDWLEKHASDYYLQVDPRYAGCANIAGWLKKGNGD